MGAGKEVVRDQRPHHVARGHEGGNVARQRAGAAGEIRERCVAAVPASTPRACPAPGPNAADSRSTRAANPRACATTRAPAAGAARRCRAAILPQERCVRRFRRRRPRVRCRAPPRRPRSRVAGWPRFRSTGRARRRRDRAAAAPRLAAANRHAGPAAVAGTRPGRAPGRRHRTTWPRPRPGASPTARTDDGPPMGGNGPTARRCPCRATAHAAHRATSGSKCRCLTTSVAWPPATCRYASANCSGAGSVARSTATSRLTRGLCTGQSWIGISSSRRIMPNRQPAAVSNPAVSVTRSR